VGMGVQPPAGIKPDRFKKNFCLRRPFLFYAGRREGGKNTPLLVEYFRLFHDLHSPELDLVLAGSGPVDIAPKARRFIRDVGYLEEEQKWDAYGSAYAFCQPSTNESFSIVLLESWLTGKAALVNAFCPVTREHCRLSGGGLYFRDYLEFEECLLYLLKNPREAGMMGSAGKDYVLKNYGWDRILSRLEEALRTVIGNP
jgi:glycosyltransferase involved in cell wall biosynthesis